MIRSYEAGMTIAADAPVDLQTHTHFSDGKWTPPDLIDHFVREGFATAAITDHDRVDTMAQVQAIARERAFPLLVAAEMTTRWRDYVVDILCFGFENDPAPLNALCERVYQQQSDASRTVYNNLVSSGHIPQYDEAELESLVNATNSLQLQLIVDIFDKHNPDANGDYKPIVEAGYKMCTNPTAEVIAATHKCGGVALIAHPGRTDGFATFDADLLDQFRADIPIDGLEVYYPHHTTDQTALYAAYAQQHGWLVSAGSDSHKSADPPIKYRADQCAALLKRLDIVVQ